METGEELTKQEQAEVTADSSKARDAARASGFSSKLLSILILGSTGVKVGDWVVDIRNGHVRRPAVVVRKKKTRSGWLIWMSEGNFSARPSVALLRTTHLKIDKGFSEYRLTGQTAVRRIVKLFA